jgi:small subunit ribosomal protein S15
MFLARRCIGAASPMAGIGGKRALFRIGSVLHLSDNASAVSVVDDASTPIIHNFNAKLDKKVLPTISLATASNMEVVNYKKSLAVEKYQLHSTDTGSAPVQIAVMTEKIMNLAKHALQHKKDKHSIRGYQILLARRKKMMKYLKRKDIELFKATVEAVGLQKEAVHVK